MTAAIPLTKAQELAVQLTDWCTAQVRLDQLTSQRLKREIEKSRAVDAENAYIARGLLAILEWDMQSVHASFEAALRLNDQSSTLDQYATGLQWLGDYPAAADLIERAYARSRMDLSYLLKAINFSFLAGRFTRAKELVDMYDRLSPSELHTERNSIQQAVRLVQTGKITEALAEQCNRIAFDLLRERQISFNQTSSEADEVDETMFMNIVVAADEQVIDELDMELGERLFDQVAGYNPNTYWVGYVTSSALGDAIEAKSMG